MGKAKPTETLRRAMIYARVSSKEQEKEGFSIPAQLKLLKSYAQQNSLLIVKEFVDVETAKRSGRPGFSEMVDFLKKNSRATNGLSLIILVEKTDRLYRNLKDWVTIDELGPEIHFVKENVVLSNDSRSSEKFMHGIKVLMAKNYIDNLSEEIKKGMNEKAEQGLWPSFAPLGYTNVESNGKRTIAPDPVLAPVIRQLFEWYATGVHSLFEISQKIHEEGLTYRKTEARLPKSVVHKILKNPIYYGNFFWAGKEHRGTHEPIISKELYDRVQEVMVEKGNRRTRQQKHNWAFQGLLTCGHCGCALTAELKKQRYVYYHCTGYKGKCPEKYVREEEIASQFGNALRAIQLDGKVLEWIKTALKGSHEAEERHHKEAVAVLQGQYDKLQKRLDALYVDKLDGEITRESYEQKSGKWRLEQEDVLRMIEKHRDANRVYLDEGVRILELAQHSVILYEKQSMEEKRRLLNFVLSNSIWKGGKLLPNYRKPFDLIAVTNVAYQKEKATSPAKSDPSDIWWAVRDSNPKPPD
jgi:site-specific DNA recombinase